MKTLKIALTLFTVLMALSIKSFATTEEVEAKEASVTPSVTATTPEDQIPLKITGTDKVEAQASGGQKVVYSIGILLILAGAGYYGLRRFTHTNKPGKSNMQIKVLSQHYLGPKKSLAIIRVAGESILIGITEQNISMIKALALLDEELPQVLPKDFNAAMTEEGMDQDIETDDFSFEGIKSSVSEKIKSMRNIQ